MSRLFLRNLIVILTVTFWGFAFNAAPSVQAQVGELAVEDAVEDLVEVEDAVEDEDEAPAAVNRLANWGTTKAKVFGAKMVLLSQDFEVEVEQAIEVCDLDERQLKRLKIASRGAVKKAFEKWKATGLQQMGMGNILSDQDDEEEEVTPEVFTDADDIDQMTLQLVSGMMGNPFKNETPTDSKFWKKALKASLGEEQHQKLMAHRAERDLMKRQKNIASTIEALAFELRLSDEKKKAFTELLTPKMLEGKAKIGPMYEQFVLYYYASKVSKSKLKKILSKAQLQKWKSAIGPAKQIGQMLEMQNEQAADDDDVGAVGDWEETTEFFVEVDRAVDEVFEDVTEFVEGVLGK